MGRLSKKDLAFASGAPRFVGIVWAIIYGVVAFILMMTEYALLRLAGIGLIFLSGHSIYIATVGKKKFDDFNLRKVYAALAAEGLPKELIDRFFIPDRIDVTKFTQAYNDYSHILSSPYVPRWFAAAYPDVHRFLGSLQGEEFYNTSLKEAYISQEELERLEEGELSKDVLYKFKEYYKRRFPGRRLENSV